MKKDLPKNYEPQKVENEIYKRWEQSGYFTPEKCVKDGIASSRSPYFSIVLPPPNATGILHIGHAAVLAIEDLVVRYHRMKGYRTLWIPGTDHAAIATQEKVERILWNEEKKTRHDLGREKFLRKVDEFVSQSRSIIVQQIRKMGASVDWSREAFTLDEPRTLAVNTAFKKMYDDGIIYRGHRIVNWDPLMQTTVSDDEVEYVEEITSLYYLKYGPFIIATDRPETKFGDKYVVMHPRDKRYKNFKHGQKIKLEWINGPVIATIIKDECIDMNFGTGVMTITPWHDAVDFEIAERHKLDKVQIIDFDGRLLPIAGEFAGLDILSARPKIIAKMQGKGLVKKIDENYRHQVAVNSRGGGRIEPQIKEQWFVSVNKEFSRGARKLTLKSLMSQAVRSGKIKIVPKHFEKVYFHWIDNLRDWCISRQIWYGHRIPVWYHTKEIYVGMKPPKGKGWQQDPDTLDTWFSSGLWTMSTLGWPRRTRDFKTYHPTSLMETGYDILFFWVARMILMSTYLLNGEVPFKKVYLNGLVRDEKGRKMSKSAGNIIDPLEVSNKFGTDAVRLSLVIGSTAGNDIRLNEEKIGGFRNFTNKIWNISRFVLMNVSPQKLGIKKPEKDNLSAQDLWILAELDETIKSVTRNIEKLNFSTAGEVLRNFTWNKLADWYLEFSKTRKNEEVLIFLLKNTLKLWHPFMPFVTEHIWSQMEKNHLLMVEKWPEPLEFSSSLIKQKKKAVFQTEKIIETIVRIRNIKAVYRLPASQKVEIAVFSDNSQVFSNFAEEIKRLAGVENIEYYPINHPKPDGSSSAFIAKIGTICVKLKNLVDLEHENTRIRKECQELQEIIEKMEKRLSDKQFLSKAPEKIIEGQKETLMEIKSRLQEMKKCLNGNMQ